MVLYYCHARPGGNVLAAAALLGALLWLLLLFRVLGSTADSFFSPILGQLSQELGLPPRLAGGAMQHNTPSTSAGAAPVALVVRGRPLQWQEWGSRSRQPQGQSLAEAPERGSMGLYGTCSA